MELVLSSPVYPVFLSMCYHPPFPPQVFPTSSRQTIAFNCEKWQLQKSKVNNCWKSFIQISPLAGLSLSSFCFSQGPTLEKGFFSFSSSSLGIRWIAAFVFACYLNCDYYVLCFQGLSRIVIHTNITATLSLLEPLSPTLLQYFCECQFSALHLHALSFSNYSCTSLWYPS